MDIASFKFTFLALLAVLIFYLLNKKYKVGYLVLLSLSFIASFNYYILIYVVAYSLVNYFLGIALSTSNHKTALFRAGIVFNLVQIIILNYASFAIDPVLRIFNSHVEVTNLSKIIVPVGISYFTLQGIGYLINVKMKWEMPERNILNFLLYIIFFPKYLSGPIERSNHFLPQLNNLGPFNQKNFTEGLRLILLGLIKKNVIANQLSLIVNPVYDNLNVNGDGFNFFIILIQPVYLYFDFSGYTDIAIGTARLFGIRLLPNFDRPFFSESMTVFWRRFHMSLSLWFNDYIFKQTSFRLRKWKTYSTYIAVFLTWILFGIWHGAGWNFMVLGLLQAVAIIFEFITRNHKQILLSKLSNSYSKWIGRIVTYLFYGVSLVFFFSPNLETSILFFRKINLLNIQPSLIFNLIDKEWWTLNYVDFISYFISIGLIIIFMTIEMISIDMKIRYEKLLLLWNGNKYRSQLLRFFIYYLGIFLVFYFGTMQKEFVYFQF